MLTLEVRLRLSVPAFGENCCVKLGDSLSFELMFY